MPKITREKARRKKVKNQFSPKNKNCKKRKRGRPKINIDEYLKIILPYLQKGFSVNEACKNTGIPKSTVNDYMRKSEKFSAKIEVALRTVEILARQNVACAIQGGDVKTAMWYLERKCKEEFGLRHECRNNNYQGKVVMVNVQSNDEVK